MNRLILQARPLPGVSLLEVFEPQFSDGKVSFPVRVNGLHMMFERTEAGGWTTKGMAFSFEPEIIQGIIEIIENIAVK